MSEPDPSTGSGQSLEQSVEEATRLIHLATHVVALVGAGLSVESGIPPFRGPGGLWTKHGEPDLRDYERFMENPKQWWEDRISRKGSYQELIDALAQAKPSGGHVALKEMEDLGYLRHIITQNIDNLHQEAGSRAITEIHGNRTKLRCMACGHRWPLEGFAMDELPPTCPDCGGTRLNEGARNVFVAEHHLPAITAMAVERSLTFFEQLDLPGKQGKIAAKIIKEINEQGVSILLVEQNANMALQVANRGYVLETGRIVLEGTAQKLRENPQVKAAYLGG